MKVGKVLAGRYKLKKHLTDGGMAEIWLAQHLALDVPVAVKLISVAGEGRADLRQRFEREARVIAQLKSPHVVQVFDYGTEDERPFFVMELLDGQDLLEVLQVRPRWPLSVVATLALQVARGLTSAHALGIIHRDIKPGNIFIARNAGETTVKIVDFGIAKLSDAAQQITVANTILGSPYYMSPEQLRSETLDHRVDLWAFAVVLFRLCTGELPFEGETAVEITESVLGDIRTAIPEELTGAAALHAFFDRAFAEWPVDRFDSAGELAEAFVAIAGSATPLTALLDSAPDFTVTTVMARVAIDQLEAAVPASRPRRDDATWTPAPPAAGEVSSSQGDEPETVVRPGAAVVSRPLRGPSRLGNAGALNDTKTTVMAKVAIDEVEAAVPSARPPGADATTKMVRPSIDELRAALPSSRPDGDEDDATLTHRVAAAPSLPAGALITDKLEIDRPIAVAPMPIAHVPALDPKRVAHMPDMLAVTGWTEPTDVGRSRSNRRRSNRRVGLAIVLGCVLNASLAFYLFSASADRERNSSPSANANAEPPVASSSKRTPVASAGDLSAMPSVTASSVDPSASALARSSTASAARTSGAGPPTTGKRPKQGDPLTRW